MKKTLTSTKNFLVRNKTAIYVGVTLTTVIILQATGIKSMNKFLEEKGLHTEYYGIEEI
jgi:hypothetical protein